MTNEAPIHEINLQFKYRKSFKPVLKIGSLSAV